VPRFKKLVSLVVLSFSLTNENFQSICADSFEFLVQCSCIEDKYYEEYKNPLG
jgi:hypothetical protein